MSKVETTIVESEDEEVVAPRSRMIAQLMDNALRVPGTEYRVGIDPLLGLIPGIGDITSACFGIVILYDAARCKVKRWTQFRIALNILANAIFGAIPVVGDLFSLSFKSNARNYSLLTSDLAKNGMKFTAEEIEEPGFSWFAMGLIGLILVVVLSVGASLVYLLAKLLGGA